MFLNDSTCSFYAPGYIFIVTAAHMWQCHCDASWFLRTPVDFLVSFCQTPRFLNEWIVSPFQQLWEAFLLRTPKARLKG